MSADFSAFALGLGSKDKSGNWQEMYYPAPVCSPDNALLTKFFSPAELSSATCFTKAMTTQALAKINTGVAGQDALLQRLQASKNLHLITCFLRADTAVQDVPSAYLKLHLLSHRLVRPNQLNLTGIFKVMPCLAWTSEGVFSVDELADEILAMRLRGKYLRVYAVDKFPTLTDYVVPAGVRIADSARVRLGAYLGRGTTVMPAGFVNFNAGTSGPNMIEGRVSQGLQIGSGSDIGGGASTMGVLSGGNERLVSVGENCLIGANAGIGISLGDNCTVEAGLYLTAGVKVTLQDGSVVKALTLAGKPNLLWRRNSQSGCIECLPNDKKFSLNEQLHDNT